MKHAESGERSEVRCPMHNYEQESVKGWPCCLTCLADSSFCFNRLKRLPATFRFYKLNGEELGTQGCRILSRIGKARKNRSFPWLFVYRTPSARRDSNQKERISPIANSSAANPNKHPSHDHCCLKTKSVYLHHDKSMKAEQTGFRRSAASVVMTACEKRGRQAGSDG